MNVEFWIPVYLVLGAAFVGGGIVAFVLMMLLARGLWSVQNARHSYMAHTMQELRRRNNDWGSVEQGSFEDGWAYRVMDVLLRRHRRERRPG